MLSVKCDWNFTIDVYFLLFVMLTVLGNDFLHFFSWSKAVALWMLWISEFSKCKKNGWFIINVHAANEFYISEDNNIIAYVFLWPLKNETFLVRLYWCLYVNWAIILWNSGIDLSQLFIVHNLTTFLGCLNYFYIFLFF